jgi:hypothetical protein
LHAITKVAFPSVLGWHNCAVDDEFLRKIDSSLDRHTAAFDRHTAAFERNTDAFNRNSAVLDRLEARLDDDRLFMRELLVRFEQLGRELGEELTRNMRRHADEVVEELRAQRGALLAILDWLGPGGSSASA